MVNTFNRDDSKACFRCDSQPPTFRLISLERFPNESKELEPDCMAALFCDSCLKREIEDNFGALSQEKVPLGNDESTANFLSRQIGFAVVPLTIAKTESELLADEIAHDWQE